MVYFVQAPEQVGQPLSTRAMERRGGPLAAGCCRRGAGHGLVLQGELCWEVWGDGGGGQAVGGCEWGGEG